MPAQFEERDQMVSTRGIVPWHKFGTVLDDPYISVTDAFRLGGIDYFVEAAPLFYQTGGQMLPVDGHFATVRADTGHLLGVVSDDYKIIQNAEVLKFFQALVDDSDLRVETCGSIRNNRQPFISIQPPEHIIVGGDKRERIDIYIMGSWGHDGQTSLRTCVTTVRPVCANTIALGYDRALGGIHTINHRGDTGWAMEQAREVMGIRFKTTETLAELFDRLAQQPVSSGFVDGFVDALVPVLPAKSLEQKARNMAYANKQRDAVKDVWANTPDLDLIRDTKYGVLQAVGAYDTHGKRFKTSPNRTADERRFETIVLTNESLANRACQMLAGTGNKVMDGQIADLLKGF